LATVSGGRKVSALLARDDCKPWIVLPKTQPNQWRFLL